MLLEGLALFAVDATGAGSRNWLFLRQEPCWVDKLQPSFGFGRMNPTSALPLLA